MVNIERFAPDEIKVYLEDQAVSVQSSKKQGHMFCDTYERSRASYR